jgi:hypothetical protein
MDPTFFYATRQTAGRRDPGNSDLGDIVCRETGWQDSSMSMRGRTKKIIRLTLWIGLLCVEAGLVFAFYVVPQFQARNAPLGNWEMETPRFGGIGLWIALILAIGIFTLGNIGLILTIWRRYKDLKVDG